MKLQRSPIWCYYVLFYEGEKKFGSCKTCKSNVICSKGSTTGLAVHLKTHHKEVYQEFKQKKHEGSLYASENGAETKNVKKVEPNINLSLNSSNEFINTTESETSNLEEKKNIRSEKLVLAG